MQSVTPQEPVALINQHVCFSTFIQLILTIATKALKAKFSEMDFHSVGARIWWLRIKLTIKRFRNLYAK